VPQGNRLPVGKLPLPPYMRRTATGRQRSARFGSEGEQARRMQSIISISKLCKTYASGFQALKRVDLEIRPGEIFALLGPNGAGKPTLINILCGVVKSSAGAVTVAGMDINGQYRAVRSMIGLVPQELTTNAFEKVWDDVSFTR